MRTFVAGLLIVIGAATLTWGATGCSVRPDRRIPGSGHFVGPQTRDDRLAVAVGAGLLTAGAVLGCGRRRNEPTTGNRLSPCGTAAIPWSRTSFESARSASAFPRWLGNASPAPPPSRRASRRSSTARPLSGTRCSRSAFMRAPGIVQTAVSGSISFQVAKRTSPERAAVSTRNSNASIAPGHAGALRTAATAAATSPLMPATAAWAPNLIFGAAAGCFLFSVRT